MIKKIKKLKLFIFDVDGVLTDGKLYYSPSGEELKVFNVKDGIGIWLLKKEGFKVVFLTGRRGDALKMRAKDLNIDLLKDNVKEKEKVIGEIIKKFGFQKEETFFMTDDVIDLKACKFAGFVATPKDGAEEVKEIADYITSKKGGEGAVREIIEIILKAMGKWNF
jgi:3-deoxy-D-manno-octulosonate 8-phosphate phosphatase (KDO 8-P phosphatase)